MCAYCIFRLSAFYNSKCSDLIGLEFVYNIKTKLTISAADIITENTNLMNLKHVTTTDLVGWNLTKL